MHGDRRHTLATAEGEVRPSLSDFRTAPLAKKPAEFADRHPGSLVELDEMCLVPMAAGRCLC